MDRRQRNIRITLWVLFNLFLLVAIFFILDFYGIWSVSDFYKDFIAKQAMQEEMREEIKEDSLLLRKNELEKLDKSLLAREHIIMTKEKSIESLQGQIDNIMLQLKIKTEQLEEREKRLLAKYKSVDSASDKVKEQANKIENMPPAQAVSILEGLSTLEVIEIFRQMDKNAEVLGRVSIVSYLISLIAAPPYGQAGGIEGGRGNAKKAQEIVRLMGKYSKQDFIRIGGGIKTQATTPQ